MNQAETQAERLRSCGVVHHERLSDGLCWIAPPSQRLDGGARIKVLPLTDVQPKPFLLVQAHGEKYEIPYDFRGDWFKVTSPTGKPLIP